MLGHIIAITGGTTTDTGGGSDAAGGSTSGAEAAVGSFGDAVDLAVTEVQDLLSGFVGALPRVAIGLVVLALFWLLARLVRRVVKPRLASAKDESVARMVSGMASGAILAVGGFVFLSLVFPSVNASTILGGAGVLALAAGFAFQDIFENLMAGIMLIVRSTFEEGDVVEVEGGAIGVVEAVTLRETTIRTFDRQQMIVPNSQVIKNVVRVQTFRDRIRSSVVVGVDYDADLQAAEDVVRTAVAAVDGVDDDPPVEAFYVELGGSSINLEVRYFHQSGQGEKRRVQGEVVKAIQVALAEAGIDIPYPTTTLYARDELLASFQAMGGTAPGHAGATTPPAQDPPSAATGTTS